MANNKNFWLTLNVFLGLWYVAVFAYVLFMGGAWNEWVPMVTLVILAAHVLEIPLAMKMLASRNPALGRLIVMTTLFGLTWWIPASKGIYPAR
ncbi:hypothetical protein ATO7_11983 [Oceanococcus atlanticus]|uniref:Uncharacterized protein n=1 Tax=Oceanococcus atlanticus TaxID=1317117 RepID=A0A1Y1SBK5_9GAMM|nr:hypothetical protein [Oceanococcus atlanticus]ORE86012.1 hypothetical protein ATO7_11983 [Oceanococcus atlanticus]RZO86172.1 MAG: hypothetical protein EVA65_04370 [Oceanococcus sp.]